MNETLVPFAICSDGNYVYTNELSEKHRELSRGDIYTCPECGTYLTIGVKKRYYFSHKRNQSCRIDSNKEYQTYLLQQSHESEKHKFLKNKLREKLELSDDPLIDKSTVCIEKFTDGRRADVYCERNDKKIAFEIQISPLSLSIILARIDHYREKDIHLFWVIEPSEFSKPQFQKDIKHYGLSEHIYELSSDDKLLKCHFKAPEIYYADGSLNIKPTNRTIDIDLSDLKLINSNPALFDYEKEGKKLNKHQIGENSIFEESYKIINSYLSWFKKDPNVNQKTVFEAAHLIDFIPYIEASHPKFIHWDLDDPDDSPYMYLDCPICQHYKNSGHFEIKNNTGSCMYCDYKIIDLIQYLADMRHNSNKFKAAQEICHTHAIPYDNTKSQ
ncbi:MAG: DUF6035 family protein [Sulfuricurvum sp.]|uniref:DUF6035 family protein n=1 Tax=Sulfuricurvum sp. TaxID=2025608 RepID=UPI00260A9415|nr:DUF6035 family protein [Sulfuricurvum sp.]MDD2828306.1 DUF6035 family protein [Sulfuricurvum sp.]MDD4949739.1 DUF6035 family protein [Sulfuricurvum sp.]